MMTGTRITPILGGYKMLLEFECFVKL